MVEIRQSPITRPALDALARAYGSRAAWVQLTADLLAGLCTLWRVQGMGWMVTAPLAGPGGPGFDLVAGARGPDDPPGGYRQTVAAFMDLAARRGLFLRVTTYKRGVGRILRGLGFNPLYSASIDGDFQYIFGGKRGQ